MYAVVILFAGGANKYCTVLFWLSEKTVRKFAELRIAYTVSGKNCSPARDCTGDIRVMELFNRITEQEASNQ